MSPNSITETNTNSELNRYTKSVYFKITGTSITKRYNIDTSITIGRFIDAIKNRVRCDFYLNNIELVEVGQNINGVNPEDANAIPCHEYSKIFRDKYNDDYNSNLAFYIRPIRGVIESECNVCWDMIQTPTHLFHCTHTICTQCFQGLCNNNLRTCPVCRSSLLY